MKMKGGKDMKKFEKPILNVQKMDVMDVIAASNWTPAPDETDRDG